MKSLFRIFAAAIGLSLGACSAGADRSVYEILVLKQPEAPRAVSLPTNSGDIKSKVKRDGYPDPDYLPNPERLPELTEAEREAMKQDLRETGRQKMENRVMTCGAEDPAKCVQ